MLNPDGVVMGNYRTGFGGKDLNRRFKTFGNVLYCLNLTGKISKFNSK